MRGLVILFMALVLSKSFVAKTPAEIPVSDIPVMRTGFSVITSASDTFNRACRNMVSTRFAQTISEADPDNAAIISNTIHGFIPPAEFASAVQENAESTLARLQTAAIQVIKPKLSPSLQHTVPEKLILLSGFTPGAQDPLDMAGCYIRLGNNLREVGLVALASSSFLNSGAIYAKSAQLLLQCAEQIANQSSSSNALQSDASEQDASQIAGFTTDLMKCRVDMLVSTAQNYYWAYCNEARATQKATIKTLAEQYFGSANACAALLSTEEQTTWLAKIARERAVLLAHTG